MSHSSYQEVSKLSKNGWITDPSIEDPDNLPQPLGWTILIRPYAITNNEERNSLIFLDETFDYMNYVTNIGRVVAMGPCCYQREEHKINGEQKNWVEVGDFVSFSKNVGSRRKFKGVSYVLLVDDDVLEKLPDPQVFDDGPYKLNVPLEHLEKYNTVYKKETK